MATPRDAEPVPPWVEEDPEIELTMDLDDDELEFDEYPDDEKDLELKADSRDDVPLWRLIEMSKEDRSLRLELADFEDYDETCDGALPR